MSSPQHALYLPRLLLDWLREEPDTAHRVLEGTAVFADVSGFTALTERLAQEHGKTGAEEITRIMNEAFAELVEIVFMEGGDLLRYGGDALFCFFEGPDHAGRAARACIDMSKEIAEIDAGPIDLGISIGLASGTMEVLVVGDTDREMFFRGSVVDDCMAAEAAANTGQVFAPIEFAGQLPGATVEQAGDFIEIIEDDPDTPFGDGAPDVRLPEGQDYSAFVSSDLRERLTLALVGGEHRPASIGFVMYRDQIEMSQDDRVAALDEMFRHLRQVCDHHGVAYLQNDVYPEGGKFLIADGVPQRSAGSEGVAAALFDIVNLDGPFALRGGCARGYVFAGDLGAPNRRAYTVMADTANLAARLASRAPDGGVLVTEAALERSRGAFTTERGEALDLKGKSMAVRPFLILDVEETHEREAEVPLFGRDRELATLRSVLARGIARGGPGVAALSAELGLGKSLLAEVASADLGRVVLVRCGAEIARGVGFTGRLLEQLLEMDDGSDVEGVLDEARQRSPNTDDEDFALLRRAFGLDTEGEEPTETTGELAARLGRVVGEFMGDLAGDEAILFRFEAADEAGPIVKSIVREVVSRSRENCWAVLVMSKAPVDWVEPDLSIVLEPFDHETSHAFVRFLLGDSVLPSQTIEQILERGMGNPYVIQELTNSALVGGEVPESIEAAAVAKMDRLDPRDEQLLCLAAVLGNEARIELLTAVLPDPALAEDASSWARLTDFVDTSTVGKIRFRDPVLRDAAYGMLPMRRRQEAHGRVAERIEQRARRRPERFAGELAYHFHRAGVWDKSWMYSRMAAQAAGRRLDLFGAVRLWRQALAAAEHTDVEAGDLLEAEEGLGDACEKAALYTEAIEALELARRSTEDPARLANIDLKIGMSLIRLGHPDEARARFDRGLEEADAGGVEDVKLAIMVGIAGLEIRRGHVDEAGAWCDRVIEEGDPDQYPAPVARAYYNRSLVSSRLGRPTAEREAQIALELYESIDDKIGAANALNNLGTLAFYTGHWTEAEEYHRRNLDARRAIGDVLGVALAGYNLGELLLEQGRYGEARQLLERSLSEFRGAGHLVGESAARLTIGRLEVRIGALDKAREQFDRAAKIATEADAGDQLIETALGRVELALAMGDLQSAGEYLDELDSSIAGTSGVRHRLYEAAVRFATGDEESARGLLDETRKAATEVGATHLEFAADEMRARLFGEGAPDTDELGDRLGMVARPVYRLGPRSSSV